MAELHLRIKVKGGNTTTRIGKAKDNERIVFCNDDTSRTLTVTLDRDVLVPITNRRLRRIRRRGRFAYTFTVAPGNQAMFMVKPGTPPDTELKYTAQITGSTREDPIIIIER